MMQCRGACFGTTVPTALSVPSACCPRVGKGGGGGGGGGADANAHLRKKKNAS